MKVNILGGGPSGLYLAYLLRKKCQAEAVTVHERNAPDATYGFGVVLADRGRARLREADSESFDRIEAITHVLQNQDIRLNGRTVTIEGENYGGAVARLELLEVLQELCRDVGVELRHGCEVSDPAVLDDADVVVGADGANSSFRAAYSRAFGTQSTRLTNSFAWYGAALDHDRPTLSFRNAGGGAFCAHFYPYAPGMCTFVMECDRDAWEGCNFGSMDDTGRTEFVGRLYAEELDGRALISNKSEWRNFEPVWNRQWTHGHRVLIGDAVRRAHFSIGSGTRIAMEDSIALAEALRTESDVARALAAYVANRKPSADKLIGAARESYTWYEAMAERMAAAQGDVYAFAHDYLTRTSRVDDARLATDHPGFMQALRSRRERTAS